MGGRHWHLPGWKPEMVLNILLCVELPGPGYQQCQLWVRAPALVTECVLKKGGCRAGGHEGFRQSRSVMCPTTACSVCAGHMGTGSAPPHSQVSEGGSVEMGGDGGPGEMGPYWSLTTNQMQRTGEKGPSSSEGRIGVPSTEVGRAQRGLCPGKRRPACRA